MILRVKALELGEVAADLGPDGLFLGEEGRVSVTMEDETGRTAVAVLTADEAAAFGRQVNYEAGRARGLSLATRLRDLFRKPDTPGARTYREQGGPW